MASPLSRSGGSQKTETSASATSTAATIHHGNQSEPAILSSAREKPSFCEQRQETPHSHGDGRNIVMTGNSASNAVFSATKADTSHLSLSDRLTLSLISSGLVRGITPSLTRKQSGQPIQVLALDTPDGGDAARRNVGCSSLSDCRRALEGGE